MPVPNIQSLPKVVLHNDELGKLIKNHYAEDDVTSLLTHLESKDAFQFPTVPGRGLFRGHVFEENGSGGTDYTGYSNVWIRDNIHVAHAHLAIGKPQPAVAVIMDIAKFWNANINRFLMCISGKADTEDAMQRPHIRFDGTTCTEITSQTWSHAQNDAIGYFLWLTCKLGRLGHLDCSTADFPELLSLIVLYFYVIGFWSDRDNGHWEEARKIEASSIGTATAGIRELRLLTQDQPSFAMYFSERWNAAVNFLRPKSRSEIPLDPPSPLLFIQQMEQKGLQALDSLLPFECRDKDQERRTDAALLFLVYPLQIVKGEMAANIVTDVVDQLAGDHGIRRYIGDSYWMANYKSFFTEANRTVDFSADMSIRDKHLKAGEEAQWCIFDSIISIICGLWALEETGPERKDQLMELHSLFLSRSVGQVTGLSCQFGPYKFPESYYIENGVYVTNDICGILWGKANLLLALHTARNVAKSASAKLASTK